MAPTLLNLDQFHVTVRGAGGDPLVDTTVGYDAGATTTLGLVLGLDALPEPLAVRVEVLSLGRLMFQAENTFVVDMGAVGTSEIHTVSSAYAGPGLDVAQLEIQPARRFLLQVSRDSHSPLSCQPLKPCDGLRPASLQRGWKNPGRKAYPLENLPAGRLSSQPEGLPA